MDILTLRRLMDQALTEPPDDLMYKHHDKYVPYYHLMYLLVKEMSKDIQQLVVVELGMDEGRGAASFAAGSDKALVYGIDHTRRDPPLGEVLGRYPNVIFLHMMSLPAPLDRLPPINILHIDTEHTYEQARSEFDAYATGLAPGAVVMFDDLHKINDEVQHLFDEIQWDKIQDDRLHPEEYFMKGILEGYGVAIAPS